MSFFFGKIKTRINLWYLSKISINVMLITNIAIVANSSLLTIHVHANVILFKYLPNIGYSHSIINKNTSIHLHNVIRS